MRRILKMTLKILLGLLAVLVIVVVAAIIAIRPPKPVAVPSQGVTLSGVTIVNPGGTRETDRVIVAKDGLISDITAAVPNASIADTSRYKGYFVLPGLIDMHTHNPPSRAAADLQYFYLMYLVHGVTTIRDTGNDGFMLGQRSEVAEGKVVGPRIFTCGPILDGDPPVWSFSRVVHNAAEADHIVDDLASQGVDFVKVYERLTPDALAGIEAAAKRHNLPVVGHVPEMVKFEDAHIDDVQHLTGTTDMPQKLYTSFPELVLAGAKGWHDLDDQRIAFVIKTSLEQHIAHTPTIVVLDRTSRGPDFDKQLQEPVAQLMPRWYPEIFWRRSNYGFTPEDLEKLNSYGKPLPKIKLLVRRMHEAGVRLHVGTDTLNPFVVPGESMHEEMHNFLDCGFTPEQAWQAATSGNGASLPAAGLGVLKPGAPADFVVYKEDPTQNLDALSSMVAVVANGRLYTRDDLNAALLRFRQRFDSPGYKFVIMTLARTLVNSNRPRNIPSPDKKDSTTTE